jgi:hypothetical protein
MRLALLKTGLRSVGCVLTPRDIDLEPGIWTRAHRSPNLILSAKSARVKTTTMGLASNPSLSLSNVSEFCCRSFGDASERSELPSQLTRTSGRARRVTVR